MLGLHCLLVQWVFDLFVERKNKEKFKSRLDRSVSWLIVTRQRPLDWKRFSETANIINWKLLTPYFLLPISDLFH